MSNLIFTNIAVGRKTSLITSFSATLELGKITVLLGPNGAGKTTLFRTILGELPLLSGEILYQQQNIFKLSTIERAKLLAFMLTEREFDIFLTVDELLKLGRYPHSDGQGFLNIQDWRVIDEYVEYFNLASFMSRRLVELSDGEKQRVFLARVFIQETPFIFLDEPTSFLDVKNRIELMLLIRKLAVEKRRSILFSTHDIELAVKLFDQFWLLDKQNSCLHCGDRELLKKEAFQCLFTGKQFSFNLENCSFDFNLIE